MKREHHHLYPLPNQEISGTGAGRNSGGSTCGGGGVENHNTVKCCWESGGDETQNNDGGMDELLGMLGYKVRTSDMAEVAQKLEQLEVVMGNAHHHQEDSLSQLQRIRKLVNLLMRRRFQKWPKPIL